MTERTNGTIKSTIKKYVSQDQKDWDFYLSTAVYAFNTSRHESTGSTPFYLVHGREARLPLDLELPVMTESSGRDKIEELTQRRFDAQRMSMQAHQKSKVRFDRHRSESNLKKGQLVLRCVPVRKKGLSQAFLPQKTGPYIILDQTGPNNYKIRIQDKPRAKALIVNVKDLVPYHSAFHSEEDSSSSSLSDLATAGRRSSNSQCVRGDIGIPSSDDDDEIVAQPIRNSQRSSSSKSKSSDKNQKSSSSHHSGAVGKSSKSTSSSHSKSRGSSSQQLRKSSRGSHFEVHPEASDSELSESPSAPRRSSRFRKPVQRYGSPIPF
jgi:hypothetical protein